MIPQRIADYLRERRIRVLGRQLAAAIHQGRKDDARVVQASWFAEIKARSPEQVARMERAEYLRLSPRDRRIFDEAREQK